MPTMSSSSMTLKCYAIEMCHSDSGWLVCRVCCRICSNDSSRVSIGLSVLCVLGVVQLRKHHSPACTHYSRSNIAVSCSLSTVLGSASAHNTHIFFSFIIIRQIVNRSRIVCDSFNGNTLGTWSISDWLVERDRTNEPLRMNGFGRRWNRYIR